MTSEAGEPPVSGLGAFATLLRAPHVAPYLVGRTVSAMGVWMERLALGWLVWEATSSPAWLGAVAFLRLAPALALAPLGGVIADRSGAIGVVRRCHLGMAAVVGALAAAAASGLATLVVLCGGALALGSLQALANAPAKAAINHVSPRALLPVAIPVNSIGFNVATFVGPAVAGLLLAGPGAPIVFAASAAAFLLFAIVLIPVPETERRSAGAGSILRDLRDAVGYARAHRLIGPMLALHLSMSILLRPIVDMLPAVAEVAESRGPEALGTLTAALGLGAMTGAGWLAFKGGAAGLGARVAGGAFASGLAALSLSAASGLWTAAMALAALGAAMVVRAAGAQTLVQLDVEDAFRGRVMGLWGLVHRVGAACGGLVVGFAAEWVGMRATFAACAVLCIGAAYVSFPLLRRQG